MEKIGILGGTFDPVHIEHIELAKNAVSQLNLDKLIVMPTFIPPHKNYCPLNVDDRINMLKIAFNGVDKVFVSDYEINKKDTSYTYQTVEHFKTSDNELYFIVGLDMLTDFKTWKFPQRILDKCTLAVFGREGFFGNIESEKDYFIKNFNKSFCKLNYCGKNISSTKIRTYAQFRLPLNGLVSKGVEDYIYKNNLYAGDKYTEYVIKNLPEKRLIHTANVVICALKQVKNLNLDRERVRIACTLHDCAKYQAYTDYPDFKLPNGCPPPVVHSYLGAYVAENVLGLTDSEIISAIRFHTSGKANMTTLEKLVFVADMIEDGRDYEGVEKLREIYEYDFEKCFIECLKEETLHLINKNSDIFYETLNAYDYYVKEKK